MTKKIFSSFLVFTFVFSVFVTMHNVHNKKKIYFVKPFWVAEQSKAFELGQWPQE